MYVSSDTRTPVPPMPLSDLMVSCNFVFLTQTDAAYRRWDRSPLENTGDTVGPWRPPMPFYSIWSAISDSDSALMFVVTRKNSSAFR